MKKVTDKDLLAQLNGMGDDDLQSPLHHVKKLAEPSGHNCSISTGSPR